MDSSDQYISKETIESKWIEQQEKILNIQQSYSRELMDFIYCHFLYIKTDNSLDNVVTKILDLDANDKKTVITMEKVLQLIQSNRISTSSSKFIFQESFLFHIDLEPENIQQYVLDENYLDISKRFLHKLPLVEDIVIPPSVFIFHNLNGLYFIFKEISNKQTPILKSILKNATTKKKYCSVSFGDESLENIVFGNMFSNKTTNDEKIENEKEKNNKKDKKRKTIKIVQSN